MAMRLEQRSNGVWIFNRNKIVDMNGKKVNLKACKWAWHEAGVIANGRGNWDYSLMVK